MSSKRVVITGVGIISALGLGKESLFNALLKGKTAFSSHSFFLDGMPTLPPYYGAYIEDFSAADFLGKKGIRRLSREVKIFLSAAVMAREDADLNANDCISKDIGVVASTTFAGLDDYTQLFVDGLTCGVDLINPSQTSQTGFNAPASELAIYLGTQGVNITLNSLSGLDSLAYAAEYIRKQYAKVIFAGGIETLSWFTAYSRMSTSQSYRDELPPQPFDLRRKRPVLGEAGVVFVLEDYEYAHSRGARIIAEISGYGCAFNANLPISNLQRASTRAIAQSLNECSIDSTEIEAIFASGNGHPITDACEAEALYHMFGKCLPVHSCKGVTGENIGAGGIVQATAALLSLETGVIPQTTGFSNPDPELPSLNIVQEPTQKKLQRVLINSLNNDGQAAALVISKV
ncbi:MAG: beta-ketoacyl synthase N-terminal-like domain-containing protein [Cyanobacteria bacterium P01_A01_bin.84]